MNLNFESLRYIGKLTPPRYKRAFSLYEIDQANSRWLPSIKELMKMEGHTKFDRTSVVLFHIKEIEPELYDVLIKNNIKVRGILYPITDHHEWELKICIGFELNSRDETLFRLICQELIKEGN